MSKPIKINDKWDMVLPDSSADEWIGNMEHHNNEWEMNRLLALENEIKTKYAYDPIVYYVGAYKGDMSAMLQTWGARICNFEATPAFWSLIRETWELNKLEDPVGNFAGLVSNKTSIEPHKYNLTKWPEEIHVPYFEGKVGFSHLAESKDVLPEITLDDFYKFTDLKPDIITMDIEGSELQAFKGALNILDNVGPTLIISIHPEFMYANHGDYEHDLHQLLWDHGYGKGEHIDYDHEHHYLFNKEIKK